MTELVEVRTWTLASASSANVYQLTELVEVSVLCVRFGGLNNLDADEQDFRDGLKTNPVNPKSPRPIAAQQIARIIVLTQEANLQMEAYTNVAGQRLDMPDPAVTMTGKTMGGADFKLIGTTLQAVVLQMRARQAIYSETGALSWMSDGIDMNTNMGGGIGGIFKRAVTGDSLFVVDYTCQQDGALVAFSSDFPGKIVPIHLAAGQSMIAQKGAFLVGEKSVAMSVHFRKQLGAGLFGGEGFLLQKFDGPGTIFACFDGEIVEYTLQAGQRLKVDTGHVAMFEPTVHYDIEMVKGFKNIIFGGEGLFFATLSGPGRVWLQTMPMSKLAGAIAAYLPRSESPRSDAGGGISLGGVIDSLTR